MQQPRIRGSERKTNVTGINTPLLLVCLAHIARHSGVAMPKLLKVAKDARRPISRSTLNRLLTDSEHHLGVRVRFRRDGTMPSRGEYWIKDWGVLDAQKVLARANNR